MKNIIRVLMAASAAFFIASASAQNPGAVTNHAFAVGKGLGQTGFTSLPCGSGALPIGQSSADPQCIIPTGDITITAPGVTAIGANKVSNAQIRQSAALSLIGRSANSTGNVADISAVAASSCVFQENASTLTCASIGTASIAANAVTNAKLATMTANTVKANATGSTAVPTDVAPAAARSSSLLNVDSFTGHGDSIYTILATDRTVGTNAAFTASRTWTLPAASAVNPGQEIVVADFQGTVTVTNTLVISRAGSDTVNGGTTATISAANGAYLLKSDGVSKWTAQALGAAAAGGVSSVTCGTGLSGGTITTSGTCAISLTTAGNTLGSDVGIANGSYTDGPSMAQGTSGTWDVKGSVTVLDTASTSNHIFCKLWDGTTVKASGSVFSTATNAAWTMTLDGIFSSPAANIKISCQSQTGTATFKFNFTGASNDSTINGIRIQ